jgi:3'-phosphoadenosine 5'-phosphosulfate sulfotransferase (PAPS reductase)/FAD synthetase
MPDSGDTNRRHDAIASHAAFSRVGCVLCTHAVVTVRNPQTARVRAGPLRVAVGTHTHAVAAPNPIVGRPSGRFEPHAGLHGYTAMERRAMAVAARKI